MQKGGRTLKKKDRRYVKLGLTLFLTTVAVLIFYDTFYHGGTLQRFASKLIAVLAPVLYGLAMAYMLNPIVKWFEKSICYLISKSKRLQKIHLKNGRAWLRGTAILLTWAVVLVLLYLLMSVLIPQLVESITQLIRNARSYYYKIYKWGDTWLTNNPEIGSWANDVLKEYYTDAVSFLTNTALPWAQEMATSLTGGLWMGIWSVINFVKNLLVGLIVSVYLLAMKENSLSRSCKLIYATFKEERAKLIISGAHRVNVIFSGFVHGKLLDSLIIGILCFIVCSMLSMPYTPLVSVVVGVTNIIPFFGPFLGAIPSAILILLVSPRKCLIFIIFILILQQFDGNILGPKILGESTGISSLWVVIAILVGGGFGGVLGMFLGVPICACLQTLVKYRVNKRLQARDMPTQTSEYSPDKHLPKPKEKTDKQKKGSS